MWSKKQLERVYSKEFFYPNANSMSSFLQHRHLDIDIPFRQSYEKCEIKRDGSGFKNQL